MLVTELDVDDEGGPSDFASRDRAVADEAARFLDVALDSPATRAVLTWSLSDRYLDPPDSWRLQLLSWRDRKVPYDSRNAPQAFVEGAGAKLSQRAECGLESALRGCGWPVCASPPDGRKRADRHIRSPP